MVTRQRKVDGKTNPLVFELLKAAIPLIMGFFGAIGLLFTPLQKVIFELLWRERANISLSVDTARPIEGDIVGLNVLISPETVVGLSGGSLTVSVDGRTGAKLLSDNGESESTIVELSKLESPKLIRFRLIARSPGQAQVNVKIANSKWASSADAQLHLEISPRPIGNCGWDPSETRRNFTGRWVFDIESIGPIELSLREQDVFQLAGEFTSSSHGSGRFTGKRDGDWFGGELTFDVNPLFQMRLDANYERSSDKGLVVSKGGTAKTQRRSEPKRNDWKDEKSVIFRAFCSLR